MMEEEPIPPLTESNLEPANLTPRADRRRIARDEAKLQKKLARAAKVGRYCTFDYLNPPDMTRLWIEKKDAKGRSKMEPRWVSKEILMSPDPKKPAKRRKKKLDLEKKAS